MNDDAMLDDSRKISKASLQKDPEGSDAQVERGAEE